MTARPLSLLVAADVSPTAVIGGAERVVREHVVRLHRRGHRPRVLARHPGGAWPAMGEVEGVPVHHFPVDRRGPARLAWSAVVEAARGARALVRAERPGAVVLHQPLVGLGVLLALGRRAPGLLYCFHSCAAAEYAMRREAEGRSGGRAVGRLLLVAERFCLRRARRVIVLSQFSRGEVLDWHPLRPERVVIVPGGVDPEVFRPPADRAALRARLGLAPGAFLFLTLRNLEPRMGLEHLLDAMRAVARAEPEARLWIGGAGSLAPRLRAQAAGLDLGGVVRFLGFVPEADLPDLYGAADVFVLPTRSLEGFGLVTVEALSCGTPVLGTAVGATPELLRALDPTLLIPAVEAGAMAAKMLEARKRPDLARLRAACREHAATRYPWTLAVAALEQECLAAAGAA